MRVADFITLVEERGMTYKYHEEWFKDANGKFRLDGLLVSCGQESAFFTWGLIRNQEQGLLEDLAQLEEKGTPKDYEAPLAEYPFKSPPEPHEHTELYPYLYDTFSYKREYVRRMINGGVVWSQFFFEPVATLAQEVGLTKYYETTRGERE